MSPKAARVAGHCIYKTKDLGGRSRADCMLPDVCKDSWVAVAKKIFGFLMDKGAFFILQKSVTYPINIHLGFPQNDIKYLCTSGEKFRYFQINEE